MIAAQAPRGVDERAREALRVVGGDGFEPPTRSV